jgi:hypothetical protein
MKSNNHYIWDEYKKTQSYSIALSYMDQIKEFARTQGRDPRGVKIIDKKTLTESNVRHADCEIVWTEGPIDWADNIDLSPSLDVSIEAREGNRLTFYSL